MEIPAHRLAIRVCFCFQAVAIPLLPSCWNSATESTVEILLYFRRCWFPLRGRLSEVTTRSIGGQPVLAPSPSHAVVWSSQQHSSWHFRQPIESQPRLPSGYHLCYCSHLDRGPPSPQSIEDHRSHATTIITAIAAMIQNSCCFLFFLDYNWFCFN